MKEEFLHFIWKYSYYHKENLITNTGEKVKIISEGEHNHNSGPDFINAKIKIGNTLWAGNVEIHINSSDWNKHNHSANKDYNNVILQAVIKDDCLIKRDNGEIIPAIELKFNSSYLNNYESLQKSEKWISCEDKIQKIGYFKIQYWLHSLVIERFIEKTKEISVFLQNNNNNWEETFFIFLAKSMGAKINSQPFEQLAKSLPLKVISKYKFDLFQLEALLFGQAGFLNEQIKDDYYQKLQKEYLFIRQKHKLISLNKYNWKFLRLRPYNFPTLRLAQFAGLIYKINGLFSLIIESSTIEQLVKYFEYNASTYWNNHYLFGKESKYLKKSMGKNIIHTIILNAVIPFLFCYGDIKGDESYKIKALSLLESCKAENNSIVKKWGELGIVAKNALESQALLQLKNKYCKDKLCLYCQLGYTIISI